MRPPSDPVIDFKIALPPNWERLDVDPRTRRDSLADLLDRRIGAEDSIKGFRVELEAALIDTLDQTDRAGVRRAWLLADEMGGKPVSASLLVSVGVPSPGTGGDPAAVAQALVKTSRADDVVTEHGVVQLPIGRAARIRRRISSRPSFAPGRDVPVEATQYFIPIPGADHVLVLAFSTPIVALAAAFTELFDAIAGTFQWAVSPEGIGERSDGAGLG